MLAHLQYLLVIYLLNIAVIITTEEISDNFATMISNTTHSTFKRKATILRNCKEGITCADCNTVSVCNMGRYTEIPCRGIYGYCNEETGTCTAERRECDSKPKTFICNAEGYFPDADNCRLFHVCKKQADGTLMSYDFSCDLRQVFDPKEKQCIAQTWQRRCLSVNCLAKQGRFAVHPADTSIYSLCKDYKSVAMYKCQKGLIFDEREQKCTIECKKVGNVSHPTDCYKYFECNRVFLPPRLQALEKSCPNGELYSTSETKCIPQTSTNIRCENGNPVQQAQPIISNLSGKPIVSPTESIITHVNHPAVSFSGTSAVPLQSNH